MEMTPEQQIEHIDISIEQAQESVNLAKALDELSRNRNFKKIITEGYFEKESTRAVLLKADPEMQDEAMQKSVDNIITGIGQLRQYFVSINFKARMAQSAIADNEQAREEILAEDVA